MSVRSPWSSTACSHCTSISFRPDQRQALLDSHYTSILFRLDQRCLIPYTPPYLSDWSSTAAKQCEDFEWSQYQITTLLEYYSRYPQLWDTKHEQYMNKDVRRQLITTLSETVGAPGGFYNTIIIICNT